jgi:hypothetical protein
MIRGGKISEAGKAAAASKNKQMNALRFNMASPQLEPG